MDKKMTGKGAASIGGSFANDTNKAEERMDGRRLYSAHAVDAMAMAMQRKAKARGRARGRL